MADRNARARGAATEKAAELVFVRSTLRRANWYSMRGRTQKHLARWWGPDGFTTTTRSIDIRPGGEWRFVVHGPDGRDYENRITYDEIVRPERLVYSHGGGEDVEPVAFQTTVTFEAHRGKTKLTMRMVFPSAAERDRVVEKYRAVEGANQTLGRLGKHLETIA